MPFPRAHQERKKDPVCLACADRCERSGPARRIPGGSDVSSIEHGTWGNRPAEVGNGRTGCDPLMVRTCYLSPPQGETCTSRCLTCSTRERFAPGEIIGVRCWRRLRKVLIDQVLTFVYGKMLRTEGESTASHLENTDIEDVGSADIPSRVPRNAAAEYRWDIN